MTTLIVDHYHRIPNEFWDLDLSAAERIVLYYILRHTYGFGEEIKHITIDEFQYGRKRADGTRLDMGTGLGRGTISEALNTLEDRRLITVVVDARDLGRIRKYYGVVIRQSTTERQSSGSESPTTDDTSDIFPETDTEFTSNTAESSGRTRSEKHTLLKTKQKNNAGAVKNRTTKSQETNYDETTIGEEPRDALKHNDGREPPSPTAAEPPSPILAKLRAFGVHEEMAHLLVQQFDELQITAAIAEARRSADRNPPGFVVDALRGGWLGVNKDIHGAPATAIPEVPDGRTLDQTTAAEVGQADRENGETETVSTLPAGKGSDYWDNPQRTPPMGEWGSPEGYWWAAYRQLELMLDRPTFEVALKGARLRAVVGQVWQIEVKNTYAQQQLQGRWYRGIRRVVRDVYGDPVELEFIEQGSGAAAM